MSAFLGATCKLYVELCLLNFFNAENHAKTWLPPLKATIPGRRKRRLNTEIPESKASFVQCS